MTHEVEARAEDVDGFSLATMFRYTKESKLRPKCYKTFIVARGSAMASQTVEHSPQRYARICGALYLAIIVLGAFAEGFVANKLILIQPRTVGLGVKVKVSGDATTTALNIANEHGSGDLTISLGTMLHYL
jgi:hypothetical protein